MSPPSITPADPSSPSFGQRPSEAVSIAAPIATTPSRDLSAASPSPVSPATGSTATNTPHHGPVSVDPATSASPGPLTPTARGTKRSSRGDHSVEGSTPEESPKRLRLGPLPKNWLETTSFYIDSPASPLFYSNSPRVRPSLPARFSSSEAAAKMLSKARGEESHVRTVSLARGLVTTSQIPTSAPQTSVRMSLERASTARSSSPDSSAGTKDTSSILSSIGIIELLEQDERPTFITDLADSANYGVGKLHLVYANSSLRSQPGLDSLVLGTPMDSPSSPSTTHLQFKSWLLSGVVNGESLNVALAPFVYGGISWSCSTLRKRLRIVSGSFLVSPSPGKAAAAFRLNMPLSGSSDPLHPTDLSTLPPAEPSDYFGTANPTMPDPKAIREATSTMSELVPTVEMTPASGTPATTSGDESLATSTLIRTEHDLSAATDLLPSMHTYVIPAGEQIADAAGSATCIDLEDSQISVVSPELPSFDWTRLPVSDSMPPHIRFARSVDWGATSLGPIESWSADLRQMCNLIMASPHPAAMYWGDDHVAIYNEAYIELAGQKHPQLMGMAYSVAWAEIWDEVKGVFANAKSTGEATMKDDDCLFMKRSDCLEETYFSWSIIPMVGQDGNVMGLYNPAFEKTRRKIAERRMLTLRELGERTSSARDVKSFWAQVLGSFEYNEYDSPFLLLYSVTDESESDSSSIHSSSAIGIRQCFLEGTLGVPAGHVAAPQQIDLKFGVDGFGPVFREVMTTDKPVLLQVGSKELPESLIEGLEQRGFGDPVRAVVACPIHPTTGESILGFLVLAVNPRRPYDDDYSLFVQLLSRQLATSLASVVLFEEEIKRGQRAAKLAALDRIKLSEELAQRTQEAADSENKFTRMAEFAPVGMFIADSDGRITFANDTWYDISRVERSSDAADTWMHFVKSEDLDLVERLWKALVVDAKPVTQEFRFKAPWTDRHGTVGDTWVLFSAYPETRQDGRLKSVFGSITNISQQKWAEGIQTRKMEEAVELKRQQENFIDITSHEMRNPLSAILQCSDEISSGLTRFKQSGAKEVPDELISSCLDAAQIISLCSQHQKRIVDDILTLSKLDSQLLLVTPVDAQPLTVVQRALKMHEGELQAADIQLKFVVDSSYHELELDWVRLDPSRIMQVLINLTTNAIKFTGTESKRTITVTISASVVRPSELKNAPVRYFPTRSKRRDFTHEKDWGDGEEVYISFSVQDTGRGLNPEEKKLLFMRFSQASPRTHVQYGGSGLGLFISRELTELQGGEIGVESEAGKGSTFAFYVIARRTRPPKDADGLIGLKRPASAAGGFKSTAIAPKKAPQQGNEASDRPASSGTTVATSSGPATAAVVRRVLIVEDNLVNQRVLQKQLKNIGTEVHLANHGGEALEKLRGSTYWIDEATAAVPLSQRVELGVVLMDQEMPVMDGLTCTRRIRELEAEGRLSGHVPIIAVTANARPEQVKTALDAGMDDVVSKPFRIPELIPKIEELLAKYPNPPRAQA